MATTYQLKTFLDIITAVQEELKIQSSDTTSLNRIRRDINIIYTDEVIPFAQWKWLRGYVNLTVPAKLTAGTASVTQNSKTVVLTSAPATSQRGNNFAVIGFNEIYRVAQHAVGSTTLILDAPYNGSTSTTQSYQLWSDRLPLPSDLRETIEVTQDFNPAPLEGCGLQKFRKYVNPLPLAEGYPQYYTTGNYVDPAPYSTISGLPAISSRSSATLVRTLTFASSVSSYFSVGNRIEVSGCSIDSYNGQWVISGVSGSSITYTALIRYEENTTADSATVVTTADNISDDEHFKQLWVYPSVNTVQTTLHIDYLKEVCPLINDSDEPLIPISDRVILLYGALSRAWSRERNPEEAARNVQLYTNKLDRMAGKLDDSVDMPIIRPSRPYLRVKRSSQRFRDRGGWSEGSLGGSSGAQSFQGPANNVAIYDGTGVLGGEAQLAISRGGTGQSTASSAFNALSPTTAEGDLIVRSASGNTRLALGSNGTVLTSTGSDPSWNLLTNSNILSSAAIAYSKLSLTASIIDSDIASTALIDRTKLALGAISTIVVNNSSGVMSSTSNIAIANGGTGQTTATAAFDALSPNTTRGDLIVRSTSSNLRLGIGASGTVFTSNGTDPSWNQIANANIVSTAAIDYVKLNLVGSIKNADIISTAAIAYSKLTLTSSIVNADIFSAAAITYSKLSLGSSITNTDIISTAAITYSKLSLGTSIVNGDINSAAAIAYSKLSLTSSILDADVNSAAAIANSKLNLTSANITTPTLNRPVINGIVDGSTAAAGVVGEQLTAQVTVYANVSASGNYFDITSLSLTAGDWVCIGTVSVALNTATSYTRNRIAISQTAGNSSTGITVGDNEIETVPPTSTGNYSGSVPYYRARLSATGTVYLKILPTYSSGVPQAIGTIRAIRVR